MLSPRSTRFDSLLKELALEHRREIENLTRQSQHRRAQISDETACKTFSSGICEALDEVASDESGKGCRRESPPSTFAIDGIIQELTEPSVPSDGITEDLHEAFVACGNRATKEVPMEVMTIQQNERTTEDGRSIVAPGRPEPLGDFETPSDRLSMYSGTPKGSSTMETASTQKTRKFRGTTSRPLYGVKSILMLDDDEVLSESDSELPGNHNSSDNMRCTKTYSRSTTYVERAYSWSMFSIHPDATANILWTCGCGGMLFYDILMVPLQAFNLKLGATFTVLNLICTIFWTLDILRTAICGYYNKDGELVRDSCAIARKYLRTWLFFDLLLVVFDWFLLVGGGRSFNTLARFLRSGRIIRLFRLAKMFNFIRAVEERFSSEFVSVIWTIAKQFAGIIVLNHFLACAWYKIGSSKSNISWVERYLEVDDSFAYMYSTSLHWAFAHFINTNLEIYPTNLGERVYGLFTILIGLVVASTFISSITSAIVHLGELQKKQRKQTWMLRKYLAATGVPTSLIIQIQNYCETALCRSIDSVSEEDVEALKVLSTPLRKELRVTMMLPFFRRHSVFDFIRCEEFHIIERLCDSGTSKAAFLQNDHVFSVGDACSVMYFGIRGAFSYQRAKALPGATTKLLDSHEIDVQIDRDINLMTWCEASLWTSWTHCGTLAVEADCELLLLNATVFGDCVTAIMNRLLFRRISIYAKEFVQALNNDVLCDDLFCFNGAHLIVKPRARNQSEASKSSTSSKGVVSKYTSFIIPLPK